MRNTAILNALSRIRSTLLRRPSFGLQPDSQATAEWQSGLRMVSIHPNGARFESDMPTDFGGTGECSTPGWFLRAGLAACTGTSILIRAADRDIELSKLKLVVTGKSDCRGMFGLKELDGSDVDAAPVDLQITVEIASEATPAAELKALVQEAFLGSYAAQALVRAVPIALNVQISTT